MGRQNIEELKEIYPREWERACKKFSTEKARRKAFLAFVEMKKARVQDYVEREKERRRRTRALILFSSALIRKADPALIERLLKLVRSELVAREGKQEVDYLPYFVEEVKAVHPNFEFEED